MIRFGQNQDLASLKAFDLLRLWASIGKHPTTHALMECQSSIKGALNPNFLNLTINREKFLL